jgi:N-acetylmuramoyl-L-alanine amidase
VAALQARFRAYGYGIGDEDGFGPETAAVVRAFQRHFRPALVDGVADLSTIDTLARLIAARSPPAA